MSSLARFSLLAQQRFAPLFGVQFGGALNDNVLRNAVVAMVTFGVLGQASDNRALLVQAALGLFILPFVIFSAAAGQLADTCPDRRLAIRVIKACEVLTMLVAVVGLAFGSIWLLLVAVCLAGVQSAFFGPFKYALLPELLGRDELIAGNGLLNASTYLAILAGIYWGTELGASAGNTAVTTAVLLVIALLGFACTFWFPSVPLRDGASWRAAWTWRFVRITSVNLVQLTRTPRILRLVLFISWFWACGSIITAQLPVYVREVAHAGHTSYLLLLLVVCAGIALGSLISIAVLRTGVSTRWVPLGMAISAVPLFLLPSWPADATCVSCDELLPLADFLAVPVAWQVCAMLAVTSLGMGFYIVPLYAALQLAAPLDLRGRAIASNNIVNALLIVAGVLLAGVLIGFIPELTQALRFLFAALGVMTLLVALAMWRVNRREKS